jgi:amino acid transporter
MPCGGRPFFDEDLLAMVIPAVVRPSIACALYLIPAARTVEMDDRSRNQGPRGLRRRLTLPMLVLYGVGVTVGAGIYVLIGAIAAHAGMRAPLAFALAGIVMGFTAASYAELSTRFPVSAGEAAYVKEAFRYRSLSIAVGALTILIGVISAAAVSIGSAGYIREFADLPEETILIAVVLALALIAAWGILESVLLASLFTLIEVGGLLAIIVAGMGAETSVIPSLPLMLTPTLDPSIWTGIALASLLAFFAFIGFEDLANVVEEVREPQRTMPLAIALTLVISVILYFWVAAIAVTAVPLEQLSASRAPLSLVFQKVAGISPAAISAIAIVATLNTVLVQMTMASRVMYGMARHGDFPQVFGRVGATTGTPLVATATAALGVLLFALALPIERLAEWTSLATLFVFALVNLSLLVVRRQARPIPPGAFVVPGWVPAAGALTCLLMMAGALL